MSLTEFLLARIAEDEEYAHAAMIPPAHISRVKAVRQRPDAEWRAYLPDGSEAPQYAPTNPDDANAVPFGSWGWSGGPIDNDNPEIKALRKAIGDEERSGVDHHMHFVVDNSGWDESDEDGIYRVAQAPSESRGVIQHIARHDPARVLAECEAKRAIVALHPPRWAVAYRESERLLAVAFDQKSVKVEASSAPIYDREVRILAAVYANHPDYQPEWKP